ncbi:preprotein translocase subunit YajC [Tetragenococcus halophilus]|uniref:preprotein translocase subunit YajC n=1 Tax=Tetragenococcus halophilus TaxID=51669 RepID=UPI0021BA8A5A|nr:preprotein translocase subunit YajC [Tetragenococcus halophilus]MCT8310837.1 preprotein translocase subunit YajC [Tetragenococcus halophilus]
MDMWKIILWILIIILCVLYLIILPIAKRKSIKRQQEQVDQMHNNITVNDSVILVDGIKGTVKKIEDDEVQLLISKNTTITVKLMGIAGTDRKAADGGE